MGQACLKLVFSGPVGAGKTTAMQQISEIPPVQTDKLMTVGATATKKTTTVAFDYGEITLYDGCKVLLFGTPGQRYFDYMCHIAARDAAGIILLLNHTDADPETDLDYFTRLYHQYAEMGGMVIGVTHVENMSSSDPLERYHQWLAEKGLVLPIFAIDARERDDVILMIEALIASLEFTL